LAFQIVLNSLVENDFCDHELKELMVYMKKYILKVFLPFLFFLHAFDRKWGHHMLVLILDPRCKNMQLVITYLGHENVVAIVVEYHEELLLPLLIKVVKLLMPISAIEVVDL
jgi:hypothetical protein